MRHTLNHKLLVAFLATSSFFCYADDDINNKNNENTERIEVIGNDSSLEQIEIEADLDQVAGGTNLINLDAFHGSQSSLAKVLNYQPGIVVQEFFGGNDQPRINIRGSGIQDNPVNRGIQLLYDGLPLNQADGSFIIGLLDPEQAKFISVYRGANAVRYGGTTLGGAINLHPRNALNSQQSLKLETGSFGLFKAGIALGQQHKNWDYYLNAAHSQQQGFRNHSEGERNNIALNIGFTQQNFENRSYFNYTDNQFNIPFLLTKEQAINNPESVMGEGDTPMDTLLDINIRKPLRHSTQLRFANKSSYFSESSSHTLGVYAEHVDDTFRNPLTHVVTTNKNIGADYAFSHQQLDEQYRETDYLLFASANAGVMPRSFHAINPINGALMQQFANIDQSASNLILGGQINYPLTDNIKTLASLQWVNNRRVIKDLQNPGLLDSTFSYTVINPKVGLIYTTDQQQRYFSNFSTSSEAPNFWQLSTVAANPNDPLNNYVYINDLKMQTASTWEIGTQQRYQSFNWELTYYYSIVEDELISVVGDFAVNGKTINYAGDTSHQGVEFALNSRYQAVFSDQDEIATKFIYNYSDFRFEEGLYEGNQIAGVPNHLIQTELSYLPIKNWSLSTNLRWQPTDTWVDHLNSESVKQDAYFLLGLKSSYQYNQTFKLFIEFNNITNETYQSAYVIRGQSAPDLPTFIPGAGFNFSAGFSVNW
ncbi:TonB-dependent receptor family protein [Psychromonas hadalis]|uniref:TonB-dependent receptor family protein n=1 Tax=Psychromonas hadalis TaxID=211669 RepID=UPI0003B6939A|nr:TonB-dependent receptor [Psychromonas hadalis]